MPTIQQATPADAQGEMVRVTFTIRQELEAAGYPVEKIADGRWRGMGLTPSWVMTVRDLFMRISKAGGMVVHPVDGFITAIEDVYSEAKQRVAVADTRKRCIEDHEYGKALATAMQIGGLALACPLMALVPINGKTWPDPTPEQMTRKR